MMPANRPSTKPWHADPALSELLHRMTRDGLITWQGRAGTAERRPELRSYGRECLAALGVLLEDEMHRRDDAVAEQKANGVPEEFIGHARIVGRCAECRAEAWSWPGHPAVLAHADTCSAKRPR